MSCADVGEARTPHASRLFPIFHGLAGLFTVGSGTKQATFARATRGLQKGGRGRSGPGRHCCLHHHSKLLSKIYTLFFKNNFSRTRASDFPRIKNILSLVSGKSRTITNVSLKLGYFLSENNWASFFAESYEQLSNRRISLLRKIKACTLNNVVHYLFKNNF